MVTLPSIGIGTWGGPFGKEGAPAERPVDDADKARLVEALVTAFRAGVGMVDTAPTYGDGFAEEVVGAALRKYGGKVVVITKVPGNLQSKEGVLRSMVGSLRRLRRKNVDLLLLHWYPERITLREAVEGLLLARREGWAKAIGVSNFTRDQFVEAQRLAHGVLVANEVEYNFYRRDDGRHSRGVESELLPYNAAHGINTLIYKGFALGDAVRVPVVVQMAERKGCEPSQVVMAWLLGKNVSVLFRSTNKAHVRQNTTLVSLTREERETLDAYRPEEK